MHIVGLTGGLSTGKSTVAQMFKDLGATVIDADRIVHDLLKPKGSCFQAVIDIFGERILQRGRIDRAHVGRLVFEDDDLRQQLESIIHPQVRLCIQKKIQQYQRGKRVKVLILEIPLLFESHWHRQVDVVVVVRTTQAQQIERAMKKLKISRRQALQRIRAQMPLREKVRLADYVIHNHEDKRKTRNQVKHIYRHFMN